MAEATVMLWGGYVTQFQVYNLIIPIKTFLYSILFL